MAMTDEQLLELARLSLDGEIYGHSIDQFCQTYPDITEEEAYRGQEFRLKLMEEQGHHLVGYKLGGTSLAKVNQLKSTIYSSSSAVIPTSSVIYGRLMEYMEMEHGKDLVMSTRLHPKAEPELAFIMGEDLKGEHVTAADVLHATSKIAPAIEIIDSRFHNFKIGRRYDGVIDNTSSAAFMLGEGRKSPRDTDLNSIGMKLQKNGEYIGFGAGESIMGHPARAVAALVHALWRVGRGLKAGELVLSGAMTASTPVQAGDYLRADFGGLGYVDMHVV